LLCTALGNGDLAVERRRQPEDESALHLRFDESRIDDSAAIDGAGDPVHSHLPRVRQRHFSHLRHDAVVRPEERHAARAAGWQRRAPSEARRPGRRRRSAVVLQERPPVRHRVLPRRVGQFIHEALDRKGVV
jgi:hypothetical protein